MVPTGRIIRWKLEMETYSWPQTFTVVSVILLLFFASTGATVFSSQIVPIHFPLISSVVDFVCSSDQASQDLIVFHRLESPVVWTVCQVFLSGRLFFAQVWCVVTRVRKSGVFLLLSILSILSTFFPSFRLGLHCVCSSTVFPAFRTTTLCSCWLNKKQCWVNFVICAINFLYFRARYFGLICFEDASHPQILTSTTLFRIQSSVDFWLHQIFTALSLFEFYFGSLLFLRGFLIVTSLILFISEKKI